METLGGVQPREEAQQMEYIAFDAHKHYTLASVVTPDGQLVREERIEHDRGALRGFLEPAGGRRRENIRLPTAV